MDAEDWLQGATSGYILVTRAGLYKGGLIS